MQPRDHSKHGAALVEPSGGSAWDRAAGETGWWPDGIGGRWANAIP